MELPALVLTCMPMAYEAYAVGVANMHASATAVHAIKLPGLT